MDKEKYFNDYIDLRNQIDSECDKLLEKHSSNMKCDLGCSSCCQSFKIFPIEFDWIKSQIQKTNPSINKNTNNDECCFLVDDKCTIYEHRPIICRTHGFPLARFNEEYEAFDILYCQLNFENYPLSNFNNNNVYFEDTNNNKLYKINQEYLNNNLLNKYDAIQLININDLIKE
jgi:Fe-S-cluster containining protein